RRSHREVAMPVAVHVSDPGDGGAKAFSRNAIQRPDDWVIRSAGVDECAGQRTNDYVRPAVAVDITGGRYRAPENLSRGAAPLEQKILRCTGVDVDGPRIRAAVYGRARRADDKIGLPIAVQVTRTGDCLPVKEIDFALSEDFLDSGCGAAAFVGP